MAILLSSLVSCGGRGEVDGPVLTSPRPPLFGGFGMAGDISGTVVLDQSKECLFLRLEGFGGRVPVIWPAGASWRADPPAVVLAGQFIEPRTFVMGGGGLLHADRVSELVGPAVAEAAQKCVEGTGEIAFFNMGSRVGVAGR